MNVEEIVRYISNRIGTTLKPHGESRALFTPVRVGFRLCQVAAGPDELRAHANWCLRRCHSS